MAGRRCEFRAAAGKGRDGKGAERSGGRGDPQPQPAPAALPPRRPPLKGAAGPGRQRRGVGGPSSLPSQPRTGGQEEERRRQALPPSPDLCAGSSLRGRPAEDSVGEKKMEVLRPGALHGSGPASLRPPAGWHRRPWHLGPRPMARHKRETHPVPPEGWPGKASVSEATKKLPCAALALVLQRKLTHQKSR